MNLLNVSGLTIAAGQRLLVSGLSFYIRPGERVGLIGESGSGKSLTALATIGLLPKNIRATGSVRFGDRDIIGMREGTLKTLRGSVVAMVFQEPLTALDPLMKLGYQVAEPLRRRFRREGKAVSSAQLRSEVFALLERVALPSPERIANAFPHEVSGGQRQRVAIAMALACKPNLLIADEPTTALDVTTQAEILRLLDDLVRDLDMALLFISHDLPVVANVVERVVVMRQGVAVEQGAVQRVLTAPSDAYTKTLVAAARSFDRALGPRP